MRSGVFTAAVLVAAAGAAGQNCAATSTGRVAINDLGTGLYLGQYQGGLYPGGANVAPAAHHAEGLARAAAVQPLNAAGLPDPAGKYVVLSVGMSNTTQEFCSQGASEPCDPWSFMGRAALSNQVERGRMVIVNGAFGGHAITNWDSPSDPDYDRVRDTVLGPRGLSEAQVQVAWVKQADPGPTVALPATNAEAFTLVTQHGNMLRAMKVRYPNLRMVFLSSRIYAGYATTGLNPEPYAYESGFSVKWTIEAQITQMSGGGVDPRAGDLNYGAGGTAPWIGWGPYLWADGLTPRSDGLTWVCSDFVSDGTHPSPGMTGGRSKVGQRLLEFFRTSAYSTPWFLAAAGSACYANCDGSTAAPVLNAADFTCFLQRYAERSTYGNCDGQSTTPYLNVADFTCFLQKYAAGCQ